MRAIVVYESMFGNTRMIAEAVADGLRTEASDPAQVEVCGVADTGAARLEGVDLVVAGGPTHAWSMSRASTRKSAGTMVTKPGADVKLEPGADTGPGIREWLASLGTLHGSPAPRAAAFDTRIKAPAVFTGRAARGIRRGLGKHGLWVLGPAESFLVDRANHLVPGETDRARAWGARLATQASRPGASSQ